MSTDVKPAHLTALQAASWNMAERYSEMLINGGMTADHSPTIRAVVDALNAECSKSSPANIIARLARALREAEEYIDMCGAQGGANDACEAISTAYTEAEAWLAEHVA